MSSPLTRPSATPERPRRLLILLGGALIAATYLFLVVVQPVEIAGGMGSVASLVSLVGFLGGGALLVAGILPMLSTSSLVVMPLGIALNIAIGQVAGSLGMQIYLDAIGTVLVAVLALAPALSSWRHARSSLSLLRRRRQQGHRRFMGV